MKLATGSRGAYRYETWTTPDTTRGRTPLEVAFQRWCLPWTSDGRRTWTEPEVLFPKERADPRQYYSRLRTMAVQHALTTMEHHIRPDGSIFHLVSFGFQTGGVHRRYYGAAKRTLGTLSQPPYLARGTVSPRYCCIQWQSLRGIQGRRTAGLCRLLLRRSVAALPALEKGGETHKSKSIQGARRTRCAMRTNRGREPSAAAMRHAPLGPPLGYSRRGHQSQYLPGTPR